MKKCLSTLQNAAREGNAYLQLSRHLEYLIKVAKLEDLFHSGNDNGVEKFEQAICQYATTSPK